MYRYLDRPVDRLDEPDRFILAAMREWVSAARTGRCPCRSLLPGFVARGVPDALRDFGIAMAAIDRDGTEMLQFGRNGYGIVTEGEARLLELFGAAMHGESARVKRIAGALVTDDAIAPLARAAEWVAFHLLQPGLAERDR